MEGVGKVTCSPPSAVSAPGSVIIRKIGVWLKAERWIILQQRQQTGQTCGALMAKRGQRERKRERETNKDE